jgi:hypothetical protein
MSMGFGKIRHIAHEPISGEVKGADHRLSPWHDGPPALRSDRGACGEGIARTIGSKDALINVVIAIGPDRIDVSILVGPSAE